MSRHDRSCWMPSLALLVALAPLVAGCGEQPRTLEQQLDSMARSSLSQIEGQITLPGLQEEVEVIRDPWGIAHIYANNVDDIFFAQGFVAAQDRLWEIDVWRYYAEGRASEIVGPERFETDRLYRLMKYRGSREEDFASYHPEAERIFTSFADGINAYIEHRGENLPVEFELTGLEPEPWNADLSALRLIQRAARRAQAEVRLARDVVRMGAEEANQLHTPDPYVPLEVPEGLDIEAVAEHADAILDALDGDWDQILRPPVLERYRVGERRDRAAELGPMPGARPARGGLLQAGLLPTELADPGGATGAMVFPFASGETGRARSGLSPGLRTLTGADVPGVAAEFHDEPGSNNWTLAPSMTSTGGAIVANDPHRQISNPSLRYMVHLNAPGWNVIGSGEPSLPGVAIGHNDRVAWGLTIVGTDQDDLYQEVVNPDNPNQVRWQGSWEDLEVLTDTVAIRGEEPRVVELKYSRHGPIVYEDTVNHYAYALKTVLHEPGTAHYLGSLRVDQVEDCREFLEVMDYWMTPSENMICGDVEGNIGWKASALSPDRGGRWHGRLPVPGTGGYEWQGFRDDLPEEYNPPRGWIATANHNIQPEGFAPPLMFKDGSYMRFDRLEDVLSDTSNLSVEDNVRLQLDAYHLGAEDATRLFEGWTAEDEEVERARRTVAEWDHVFSEESPGAAVYYTWRNILEERRPDASVPEEVSSDEARAALRAAVDSLRARQGDDPGQWRWGAINRIPFPHPLSSAFDLPTVERRGGAGTVSSNGGTFKQVVDVADWDNSRAMNAPGQSGQPGSPYYGNLLDQWKNGEYFPYLFTRDAVEENAAHTLRLIPGG